MSFEVTTRVLLTRRLRLRPPDLRDAPVIAALAGDRDVAATTARIPHPYTEDDARQLIGTVLGQSAKDDYFEVVRAIVVVETGTLAGMTGARVTRPHRHAEIGYWIGKPYWGNGYASEAVEGLLGMLLSEVPEIEKYFGRVFAGNPRSSRILERLGFRLEGTLRSQFMKEGELKDMEFWGALAGEIDLPDPSPADRIGS